MPIFEHDDKITPEEFARQQAALNAKVNRLVAEEITSEGHFESGDCWEDENE